MALEHILAAIRDEADAELARIEAEADEVCAGIEDEARRETEAVTEHILSEARVRAESEAQRIERAAQREGAMERLRGRERVLAALSAELTERLARQRSLPSYPRLFERLLRDALDVLPEAREARVHPEDVAISNALLAGRDIVIIDDLDTAGGVFLSDGQGRRVINTLESRCEALSAELRRLAASHLPALVRGPGDGGANPSNAGGPNGV